MVLEFDAPALPGLQLARQGGLLPKGIAMLVLNRRPGEQILITDGIDKITLTVCDTRGIRVQLGIDAPMRFKIFRKEVVNKMEAERSKVS